MPLLTFALLISLLAAADEAPPTDKPMEEVARRTVPEATTRPPRPIDVLHYDLTLRLNEDDAYIRGDVRMRLVPLADLDRITLDFTTSSAAPRSGMLADSVAVAGIPLSFSQDADSLMIDLPGTITPTDTVEVFVVFEGAPIRPEGVGYGFTRRFLRDTSFVPDPNQPVLCEVEAACRIVAGIHSKPHFS